MPQGPPRSLADFVRPPEAPRVRLSQRPFKETNPKLSTLEDFVLGALGIRDPLAPEATPATGIGSLLSMIPIGKAVQQGRKALQATGTAYHDLPNFKQWFGASKVKDAAGKPLTLYHGTELRKVEKLRPSYEAGEGAIFLTSNPDVADTFTLPREYGESVYEDARGRAIKPGDTIPLHARIENPLVVSGQEAQWITDDTAHQVRTIRQAKANGHDGIILRDVKEGIGERYLGDTYIVFDNKQVKHAEKNVGTFDPKDPSIVKAP